jgi:hypothetical protein
MLSQPFASTGQQSVATLLLRGALIAAVLAALLLAHGCHSHEDNELFTSCIRWMAR